MNKKYRFDHKNYRHSKHSIMLILMSSILVMAVVAGIVFLLVNNKTAKTKTNVTGPTKIVGQAVAPNTPKTTTVNEPDYTFQLPLDWHSVSSIGAVINTDTSYSNDWESGGYVGSQIYFSVYVDHIPTNYPLNAILPVTANGDQILYGEQSSNCYSFTSGSSAVPAEATWEGVNFLCDLPDSGDNQVGTGAAGNAPNTVTLTGPIMGKHNYFFLYIDRSADPNYTTFDDILTSFRAK